MADDGCLGPCYLGSVVHASGVKQLAVEELLKRGSTHGNRNCSFLEQWKPFDDHVAPTLISRLDFPRERGCCTNSC